MKLEELLKENQDVLSRLKEKGAEYYTSEQFLKSFEKKVDKANLICYNKDIEEG